MQDLKSKQSEKSKVEVETQPTQLVFKSTLTAAEISKSLVSFESTVPLNFLVAARQAAREKNT